MATWSWRGIVSMSEPNNRWLSSLVNDELPRGRHVILHGNIYDTFLMGEPIGLRTALAAVLQRAGYEVVVTYNVATGITPVEESMEPRLQELRRQVLEKIAEKNAARLPSQATPAEPADITSSPAPPDPAPPGQSAAARLAQANGRALDQSRGSPDMALAEIAALVSQDSVAVACIVEYTDLLVRGALRSLPEGGQRQLVWLERALQEAKFVRGSRQGSRGLRNIILLLVEDLRNLEGALYGNNNPHVVPIHVGLPNETVRETMLRSVFFPDKSRPPATPDEDALRRLALLTDGMPLWEVAALQRTSVQKGIPLADARRLVLVHRHGEKVDPWRRLDRARVRAARNALEANVFGQPEATKAVADLLATAVVGVDYGSTASTINRRPRGVFFFVGPTGVGKTELARSLASLIFGDDNADAFHRFDMSEYMHDHQVDRLTGSPPGYVGHGSGGELTNFVHDHPYSLLLFDEVEKAHERILDVFLQVLDAGRLTDGQGRTVHFADSVVVFTSNKGSEGLESTWSYEQIRDHFRRAVKTWCTEIKRPELWSRIGEDAVVVFNVLSPAVTSQIIEKLLGQLRQGTRERYGLDLDWNGACVERINEVAREKILSEGGRCARQAVDRLVRVPLAWWLLSDAPEPLPPGGSIQLGLSDNGVISFSLLSAQRQVRDQE
jgi:hypothetical protein